MLEKALGTFLEISNTELLKVGLWKGNLALENLPLRVESCRELLFPLPVAGGLVGSLHARIPWKNLKTEPTVVRIESVFVLISDAHGDGGAQGQGAAEPMQPQVVKQRLIARKQASLDKSGKRKERTRERRRDALAKRIVRQILRNVQITIRDVHIRFEENGYALGVCIPSLDVRSPDASFIHSLDATMPEPMGDDVASKIFLADGVTAYMDPRATPYPKWDSAAAAKQLFGDGMFVLGAGSDAKDPHTPLLEPLSVRLYFTFRTSSATGSSSALPRVSIEANVSKVACSLSQGQMDATLDFVSSLNAAGRWEKHLRCGRPSTRPRAGAAGAGSARDWWHYAKRLVVLELAARGCLAVTWDRLAARRRLRLQYGDLLQQARKHVTESLGKQLESLEERLSIPDIFLFRRWCAERGPAFSPLGSPMMSPRHSPPSGDTAGASPGTDGEATVSVGRARTNSTGNRPAATPSPAKSKWSFLRRQKSAAQLSSARLSGSFDLESEDLSEEERKVLADADNESLTSEVPELGSVVAALDFIVDGVRVVLAPTPRERVVAHLSRVRADYRGRQDEWTVRCVADEVELLNPQMDHTPYERVFARTPDARAHSTPALSLVVRRDFPQRPMELDVAVLIADHDVVVYKPFMSSMGGFLRQFGQLAVIQNLPPRRKDYDLSLTHGVSTVTYLNPRPMYSLRLGSTKRSAGYYRITKRAERTTVLANGRTSENEFPFGVIKTLKYCFKGGL